ncbi:hypothetical protein [Streptomyces reticuliscabiei]|uniref:hypothetical protein n=1 Tax=Streptomyces reticuliscabiei TaxID=146821 RepID=UPI000A3D4C15|nr:hypothetical protein [Streptomyces reticuliscabiei]
MSVAPPCLHARAEQPFHAPGEDECPPTVGRLLAELYDAGLSGCSGCRRSLLDDVATDPQATAALLEWVCQLASEVFGGLPEEMTEDGGLSAAWRELAAVYDGRARALHAPCAALPASRRREAGESALDVLVALTHHASDLRPPGDIRYCPMCDGDDPDAVLLMDGHNVLSLHTIHDPLLAAAVRIHRHLTGHHTTLTDPDLCTALSTLLAAAHDDAPAAERVARIEDFAAAQHARLRQMHMHYGPGTPAAEDGRYTLLAHPLSIPLCERLDTAGPFHQWWPPHLLTSLLDDLTSAWTHASG